MSSEPGAEVGWDADPVVAGWPGYPALTEQVRADVCVIGLGGSGLAAIGEVLRRGLSVVGLDAGRVAAGAAGRNGGFLLGGPAIGVHRAATGWGLEAALTVYRETLEEITALADLLGPAVIQRVGSLRVAGLPGEPADVAEAADREVELADCREQFRVMAEHRIAAEWYSGELGQGLFLPEDAAMNPARRAMGLATLYQGSAQLFENSPVLSIESGSVRTAAGSVSAGLVVVAVDGKLELLLPELVGRVRTTRLQMLATEPVPVRLNCPVYGRWGYDYAQQDAAGRLYVGGGRDADLDAEWTVQTNPTPIVQGWIEQVAARFAGAPVTVSHRWAASAAYTEDGRPVVAEVRPGVVACGGYNGTGNLVGPIAARAALALGLDGRKPGEYFSS
ncbi:MAG: FAD-binding oxidoreductase [Actinomycetota bacterium]|nr:FAD-binding oxidoreductase [Actinomycetota bacterium]MDQ2957023.1 FAD-binding oxidoreductase [Actinomycetota bacterium]